MNSMPLCEGQHVKKYLFDLYKKIRILILSFCSFFFFFFVIYRKNLPERLTHALDF